MTCRDRAGWRALLAHRFAEGEEPAEWPEVGAHLESCGGCRRIALGIDPSLIFQRLPAPSALGASDVEAMRQAVAGLRRASARGLVAERSTTPRLRAPIAIGKLGRAAAAAALVLGLGSQLPLAPHAAVTPASVDASRAVVADAAVGEPAPGESLGVSGDVGRPLARVYQIAYHDMAVVMVVDKSLDL